MPGKSSILVESQSVLESIDLANSGIKLVYHSARAKDYLSTIQLQLTPDQVPTSLLKVHIRITIEGVVHEKVFEADPNIRYTYAWDGLNEYRQVRIDKSFLWVRLWPDSIVVVGRVGSGTRNSGIGFWSNTLNTS